MLEIIIVVVIVAVVALIAGRSFFRTMTGKNEGCGCGGNCHSCTCKDFPEAYQGQDADK